MELLFSMKNVANIIMKFVIVSKGKEKGKTIFRKGKMPPIKA